MKIKLVCLIVLGLGLTSGSALWARVATMAEVTAAIMGVAIIIMGEVFIRAMPSVHMD